VLKLKLWIVLLRIPCSLHPFGYNSLMNSAACLYIVEHTLQEMLFNHDSPIKVACWDFWHQTLHQITSLSSYN